MLCPTAIALWQLILPHWAACTATQDWTGLIIKTGKLDIQSERAIALGVRPQGEMANDEQWQTLRAVAIDALLKQHRANDARNADGHPALTAKEASEVAYDECRAALQNIVH